MILTTETTLLIMLFAIFGACFGSFGNVVLYRLPIGESLNKGRSHCPHCKRGLTPLELIPILSWVIQGARCRGCKKYISAQYPLVEFVSAALFVIAFYLQDFSPYPAAALALAFWAMFIIAVIDFRTQMIPDILTLTIAICGVAFQWFTTGTITVGGVLTGVCFLGAQWLLSRGRWVGSGDVLLAGALGLLLGSWLTMTVALFASYIVGAVIAMILLISGTIKRGAFIPFGPFLIMGAVIAFVWGETILMKMLP